jgi:hypothetical protein
VFFAFATPFSFEPFNSVCNDFFGKGYVYHTGKRVTKELENRWRKRTRVYEDLSRMQNPPDLNHISSISLNTNDEKHFRNVIVFLSSNYPKDQILNQLRDMQRVISKGLEEGRKKITLPYIDEFDDYISYAFLAYI